MIKKSNNKKMYFLVLIILVMSIAIQMYPWLNSYSLKREQNEIIQTFEAESGDDKDSNYEFAEDYNQKIFLEGQSGIVDVWSDLLESDQTEEIIGHVEIPRLGVDIPLYWNATYEHLNKGVAVVSQTSYPIGGPNTNCVIAGHRGGINGELFFRDIEKLEQGDSIYIHNNWDTLTYTVQKKSVIEPNDLEAVKIVEGEDMITLFSCHPYGIDSQRYVVYASRQNISKDSLPTGESYVSSVETIETEEKIRKLFLSVSLLTFIVWVIFGIWSNISIR